MRKPIWLPLWMLLSLVLGCIGCNRTPVDSLTQDTNNLLTDVPVYQMNEKVKVGNIIHFIKKVEMMERIPAEKTLPAFKTIAKDLPAETGTNWYYLRGEISNKGSDSSLVNVTSVVLLDQEYHEYQANTKTVKFIPNERMLTSIPVMPGQTVEWEAYYSIPLSCPKENLKIKVTDLSFSMEEIALIKF